jgi:hypothetical protein
MNMTPSPLSRLIFIGVLSLGVAFASAHVSYAKIGVGMGAGEIRLTEPVKPGGMYTLPDVRIFNTGDEVTTYGMNIAYHQENKQLRPAKSWFSFSPNTFTINATESQKVAVNLVIPLSAEPGEYFAFIESGPVASDKPGTSVGVAVATKLFFTVEPANLWQALSHRTGAFFATNSPWSWIGLGILIVVILALLLRKYFSFSIGVKKS